MEDLLQKMLRKQFLIAFYIEQKLQIVNFIKDGYDDNKPILIDNSFFHFTAHIYYRSIIVDLCALFGTANDINKNSFLFIEKKFKDSFKPEIVETVKDWIFKSEEDIKIITDLRDKQIAHYDFIEKESISFNFNNLSELNRLFSIAQKIICHYGSSFKDENISIGYDFGNLSDELKSLKSLINPLQV